MDAVVIKTVRTSAFKIPTATPESDGTLEWGHTILVLVELEAGREIGLGFTYADIATAKVIDSLLAPALHGRNAFDIPAIRADLISRIRNIGRSGVAAMALSAVDNAAWDLKAKLLGIPLVQLLGKARDRIEVYGSGGFTSYTMDEFRKQLSGWMEQGFQKVKIKIGRDAAADLNRVRIAREIIGPDGELFVDANGAYSAREALEQAKRFEEFEVNWFEEPVSSDNLQGLRLVRETISPGVNVTAGEYGYETDYFRRMLEEQAVDVLQADGTRCGGVTGFLEAAVLANAFHIPFSFHCAPAMHVAVACAAPSFFVGEYFFDHYRIEEMLFDGVSKPEKGFLMPQDDRPGFGLEFKRRAAEQFAVT